MKTIRIILKVIGVLLALLIIAGFIYYLNIASKVKKDYAMLGVEAPILVSGSQEYRDLNKNGVLIIGIPSLESQKYATKWSKVGHINCKSKKDFKNFLSKFFNNVFMFSMNDEVVHTGYDKMSHYLIGIACNKK